MGFLFIFRQKHGFPSPRQSALTQLFDSSRMPTASESNPELVCQSEPWLRGSLEGFVCCRLCQTFRLQTLNLLLVNSIKNDLSKRGTSEEVFRVNILQTT